MMKHLRNMTLVISFVLISIGSVGGGELTVEDKCEIAKTKADGIHAKCLVKAKIKGIKGLLEEMERRVAKCTSKHHESFEKAEARAEKKGERCGTIGDAGSRAATLLTAVGGATPPPLTILSDNGAWPSFAADGSQVVFVLNHSLLTVSSQGGGATVIVQGSADFQASRPDWSWNPDTIAFTATQPSGTTIWQVSSDGSNRQPINYTGDLNDTFYPSWYQDLQSIVAMDGGGNQQVVLYRFDLQSGTATALTSYSDVTAGRPSVNPDGTHVGFAGTKGPFNEQNNQIWRTTSDIDNSKQLSSDQGRSPNWSPDGKWILFESNRNGGNYQLFVMSKDGDDPVALTDPSENATHGEWSRQQDYIVFQGSNSGIATFPVPSQYQM